MIQQMFRVGCPCGRWLLDLAVPGMYSHAAYPDNATAFPSLGAAQRAITEAGWSGTRCACGGVSDGPQTVMAGTGTHDDNCSGQPVPVCPPCQRKGSAA